MEFESKKIAGIATVVLAFLVVLGAFAVVAGDVSADDEDGTYFFWVQNKVAPTDFGEDVGLGADAQLAGFWMQGVGPNVCEALINACEENGIYNENLYYDGEDYGWIDNFMGIATEPYGYGFSYWATYGYSDVDGWSFSGINLDYAVVPEYKYVAIVYQTTNGEDYDLPAPGELPEPPVVYELNYDVNGDGKVNLLDPASLTIKLIKGDIPKEDACCYDFNEDGKLNICDVRALLIDILTPAEE